MRFDNVTFKTHFWPMANILHSFEQEQENRLSEILKRLKTDLDEADNEFETLDLRKTPSAQSLKNILDFSKSVRGLNLKSGKITGIYSAN